MWYKHSAQLQCKQIFLNPTTKIPQGSNFIFTMSCLNYGVVDGGGLKPDYEQCKQKAPTSTCMLSELVYMKDLSHRSEEQQRKNKTLQHLDLKRGSCDCNNMIKDLPAASQECCIFKQITDSFHLFFHGLEIDIGYVFLNFKKSDIMATLAQFALLLYLHICHIWLSLPFPLCFIQLQCFFLTLMHVCWRFLATVCFLVYGAFMWLSLYGGGLIVAHRICTANCLHI